MEGPGRAMSPPAPSWWKEWQKWSESEEKPSESDMIGNIKVIEIHRLKLETAAVINYTVGTEVSKSIGS